LAVEFFGSRHDPEFKTQAAMAPQTWSQTMKMKHALAALPLVLSLALPAAAQARSETLATARAQVHPGGGREVAAPPWSNACMTDQGPSQCGEPMWVYGSPDALSRLRSAF
jgi:hypothetical protein